MKLVRIEWQHVSTWGILEGDRVFSVDGDVYTEFARGPVLCAARDAKLLAPAEPGIIVCCGVNFKETVAYLKMDMPKEPVLFFKPAQALCDPDEDTYALPMAHDIRYEAELCAVMKRRAWRVEESEALKYVLGYTCGNDMTLYDLIAVDGRLTRAKGYYRSAPLGPVLVTDMDPSAVRIQGRVNGKTTQHGNTRDQIFSASRVISHITQFIPLLPGDVVYFGTPIGGRSVNVGDLMEVEVEGIGVLRNRLVAP